LPMSQFATRGASLSTTALHGPDRSRMSSSSWLGGDRPTMLSALRFFNISTVVFCGGFTGEQRGLVEDMDPAARSKFPRLAPFYGIRAAGARGWYAGALMHGRDFRRSAGGFVHGFRYLVRAQVRYVLARDFGVDWPVTVLPDAEAAVAHALSRIQESSGLYQMQGELVDVIVPQGDGEDGCAIGGAIVGSGGSGGGECGGGNGGTFLYIEEVPRHWVEEALQLFLPTGRIRGPRCEVALEYGEALDDPEHPGAKLDQWVYERIWTGEYVDVKPDNLFLHPTATRVFALTGQAETDATRQRLKLHAIEDIHASWTSDHTLGHVQTAVAKCVDFHDPAPAHVGNMQENPALEKMLTSLKAKFGSGTPDGTHIGRG
jgi:hypothetical protein